MSVAKARSRVAVEVKRQKRTGASSPSESVQSAQRVLAEEKIKAYIERTIAVAPELTPEQRDRLALLLRPPEVDASSRTSSRAGRAG